MATNKTCSVCGKTFIGGKPYAWRRERDKLYGTGYHWYCSDECINTDFVGWLAFHRSTACVDQEEAE